MKKTIIASAIAAVVAAPAAFADVSISGQANVELYSNDGTAGNNSSIGNQAVSDLGANRNMDLTFAVSEDLGNGMKAFAKMTMTGDASSSDGISNGDTANAWGAGSTQVVGLSGDFGTISVGKQELWIESAAAAMAANDASDMLTNEVSTDVGAAGEGTVEYVSPSFNGVTIVAGMIGDASGDDADTTSFGIQYANAGLTVRAATADDNGVDTEVFGVSYTMDGLTVGVVNAEEGTAKDQTWFGASYTMGANTLAISTVDSDTRAAEDTIISLKHAMSKNVAVYLVHEDDTAAAAANDSKTTLVGMQVKF